MKVVVVAEKPSVARDIAAALGGARSAKGYLHADGDHAVTWAIGHLVALGEPHHIHPAWRKWALTDLPILPDAWPLVVLDKTTEQFDIVKNMMNRGDVEYIVCATDAGREGELIFRYIYEKAGCVKPVKRLWISSLTADAIRAGMGALRDASHFDPLARSAMGRNRADWLVGINLSRLYSLKHDDNFSVGRVQTPTLALLVEREREIRAFVPQPYLEIQGSFDAGEPKGHYRGMLVALAAPPLAVNLKEAAGREPIRFLAAPPMGAPAPQLHDGVKAGAKAGAKGALSVKILGLRETKELCAALAKGQAVVAKMFEKSAKMRSPQAYDLTELQRAANRIYGFSAEKTLATAQLLYERRKAISYPRTDSRYLTEEIAATAGPIAQLLARGMYRQLPLAPQTGIKPLDKRYVDGSKVGDHHAIIPTSVDPSTLALGGDEFKIYDLIARRFLALWQEDYESATTNVVTQVDAGEAAVWRFALFLTKGTRVVKQGWKILDLTHGHLKGGETHPADDGDAANIPSHLKQGAAVGVHAVLSLEKTTRPPPCFNDASLLTAMETAGKQLDDKEFPDVMKDFGLGTPATRAAILESLIGRGYVSRNGKQLVATPRGCQLIAAVHSEVKSPALTGVWEGELKAIAENKGSLESFMTHIREMVSRIVGMVKAQPPGVSGRRDMSRGAELQSGTVAPPAPAPHQKQIKVESSVPRPLSRQMHVEPLVLEQQTTPKEAEHLVLAAQTKQKAGIPGEDRLDAVLRTVFGFSAFRPHQKAVCEEVVNGNDVLLVMPTGAGKSLCYQLPGLVRGGTTLVISPLIALMEDQVQKATSMGIRAQRIHSGLDSAMAREVCRLYVAGELDLLYIAPERLSLPRFAQFLAQHPPALVAVDEAHCISHWGHDFRPDYRMIGDKLPLFRPAPVIALTATATQIVQDDIIQQLGFSHPKRHIHGFRRTNIAIEIVEAPLGARFAAIAKLAADPANLPAVVYAPTRKLAESTAEKLSGLCKAEAYHAGFDTTHRSLVQERFLHGDSDVIVATTAFGMGVDKANIRTVVHLALPATIEEYYQEIGRAGRDGIAARAVMFFSSDDLKTLEFFHNKNYPDPKVVAAIFEQIPKEGIYKSSLGGDFDLDTLDGVLEKLWIHGGVDYRHDDWITPLDGDWLGKYLEQKEHNQRQLREIEAFSRAGSRCRMEVLLHYFGDLLDRQGPCGICDICAPSVLSVQSFRAPSPEEGKCLLAFKEFLRNRPPQALGKLFSEFHDEAGMERELFDIMVQGLVRAGYVRSAMQSFTKEGRTISYRTIALSPRGRIAAPKDWEQIQLAATLLFNAPQRGYVKGKRHKVKETPGVQSAAAPPVHDGAARQIERQLRSWRSREAQTLKVPAFCIFTDKVLATIACERPQTDTDLLKISGVGKAKLAKFGRRVLEIVAQR